MATSRLSRIILLFIAFIVIFICLLALESFCRSFFSLNICFNTFFFLAYFSFFLSSKRISRCICENCWFWQQIICSVHKHTNTHIGGNHIQLIQSSSRDDLITGSLVPVWWFSGVTWWLRISNQLSVSNRRRLSLRLYVEMSVFYVEFLVCE